VLLNTINRRSFLAGCAAAASKIPNYSPTRTRSKLLALADEGGSAAPSRFPIALNSDRTAFLDQFGSPCFACGDSPQYLIQQLSKPEIEDYLSDRATRNINILWMIAADRVYQTNPPNNLAGDAPFGGADFTNFNEHYWAYVDHVMQRCLAYGMTVLLMPLFVGLNGREGYLDSLRGSGKAVIRDYGTFLGNRYKGFPNLIWLLGGDADPSDTATYAKIDRLAMAIKAADPDHLMTMEATRFLERGGPAPNGGYSSVDAHLIAYGSVKPWLDINWVYQTGPTCAPGAQRCYSQGLPCLLGEDWYELDHAQTGQDVRQEGYGSVLGGCTLGRLFGNQQIWAFNSPNSGYGTTTPSWQSQLSSAGSVGQQLLGNLFRSRRFHLLVPDTSHAVMTVGASTRSICARSNDGQTIIVYLPFSQTVTIDMRKITDAGGMANCNWYNPSSGAVTAIGRFANSGKRDFTSPDSNDWVLVIDSAIANLRTPGT
jgi:hypothetical protein